MVRFKRAQKTRRRRNGEEEAAAEDDEEEAGAEACALTNSCKNKQTKHTKFSGKIRNKQVGNEVREKTSARRVAGL